MVECGNQALRKVSSDAWLSQGPCSELLWPGVPQGADSGLGAGGTWLEARNRVVCVSINVQRAVHQSTPVTGRGESFFGPSLQLVGRSVSSEGALQNPGHHLAELPA